MYDGSHQKIFRSLKYRLNHSFREKAPLYKQYFSLKNKEKPQTINIEEGGITKKVMLSSL